MNFLAHTYLSQNDEGLLVGNFVTDFLRGRKQREAFPEHIKKGIELHHLIDEFTDSHPIVKQSYQRLKPQQGRYASVVLDVFYDYFLIKNWDNYSDIPLEEFTQSAYTVLMKYIEWYPPFLQKRLPIMVADNWMMRYGTLDGLRFAFGKMVHRTTHENRIKDATEDLLLFENELNDDFNQFFPDIIHYAKEWTSQQKKHLSEE